MALGKRWSLTFKSLNNTTCSVYIYDEGWTGEVTTLIGAADPFYWEEDNSESLLTVLRYRTGYLRIIEPEYNSLIALYPTSSTSRYVEFYYGERLDFTGYLQVQNFQMDWVASPRILEFPVVSPLGLAQLKKFSLYTQPTRITLGACLFNIMTALNNTANSASRYTKVVFPDVSPELTGDICTMVISGFSDQFSHADSNSPVFAAEYFDYFLEGICNAYGWILHDTPDALIFTRYDWDGAYAYYELASLAVPTNKQTCDIAGNVAYKLLDSYSVRDANATESVVQPLKSLTLNYEGKDVESVQMDFARTYTQGVIPGGKFGFDSNPQYVPGIVWLKSADNEFSGARLLDTNSLSNGRTATPGCNLTYSGTQEIGYHDRILIGWPTDWTVDSELFQWKIYQPPMGDCNFEMEVSWGTTIAQLGHDQRSTDLIFGFWMESGGKYYNFSAYYSDAGFTSDTRVISKYTADENGKIIVTISNVPIGILTIGFVVGRVSGPEMVSIDNISLSRRTLAFAEYTEVQNPTDMITGSDVGNEEGNVTLSLNCYRNDTHLIGLTPVSSKFTEYPYLFEAMNRVVCRFAASDYDVLKNYLAKWRFWIKAWRWRIIAVAFDPWNDIYTLTLHRSPILTNYSYLADSGDNIFESLDDYLFRVIDEGEYTPPTPEERTIARDSSENILRDSGGNILCVADSE